MIKSLGALENERDVRTYLYLSLGLAGGVPPESEILRLVEDPKTPDEIIALTLESMLRSGVPIRSLPRLLQLSDDPTNYVSAPGVGTPVPTLIYPIRQTVCNCLQELEITCETLADDQNTVEVEGTSFAPTVVKIDRASLVDRFREWLLDDDNEVWRAAAECVRRIPGEDIDQMLKNLTEERVLSPEKLRHLWKP